MQVAYLGPLEVRDGTREVPVTGQRLRRLLVRLALDPGTWISAGALAEAVWSADQPADLANSLQSLVSRLRRVLGRPELVEQSAAGYRLAVVPDDVDAVRFAGLVAEGSRLLESGDDAADAVLSAALELWRGEPLADDDSPEAAGRRATLVDLRVQAVRDRAVVAVRGGRAADVVAEMGELAAARPLREDLTLVLMDALVAVGRPAEALAAFERTRATLADALGTDPSPTLCARHMEVLRLGERAAIPPTNLRAGVTSFVGRDDDVRALRERLAAARLVTVVGAGGSGKTRLASEVAEQLIASPGLGVRDGVWLVELAPISDPDSVAQAMLEGLGLRDVALPDQHGDRPRLEGQARLLELLGTATCLLVVDNCEHLVDAVADVVTEVLARCPGVRVLATSREPIGIDGEVLYPLAPLAVPPDGVPAAATADNPAVRLLLERGRAVDPDVVLDDDVVEIVRRLDGLPLAIELAAARFRALSPAEVAARLADRFRLLTGGRRTATPRHRTLRAVVEWSWELLSPLEREVAEHFSVFASGAGEEAVAAVCPSWRSGDPPEELADVLHALVDKSLLVATRSPGGTRFRMLETLREYGTERLSEQGLIDSARTAHARWFAALVTVADTQLRGPGQLRALERLDTEREEVLTAVRYLGDAGDAAGAIGMLVHLGWYWLLRENGQEAMRWLQFALEVPGADEVEASVIVRAVQSLLTYGFASPVVTAPPDEAARLQAELVRLSDELAALTLDHPLVLVLRLLMLLIAEKRDTSRKILAAALQHADAWMRAVARLMLMTYAENDGDLDLLRENADAACAEWEALGDRWGLATLLSSRGQLRTIDGDLIGAAEDLERAQACIRSLGSTADHIMVTMRLADLRLRAGNAAGARRHLQTMRAERSYGIGEHLRTVLVALTEAAVALVEENDTEVAAAYAELCRLLEQPQDTNMVEIHGGAVGRGAAGGLAAHLGRMEEAEVHLREGYRLALLTHDRPILAAVGLSVASWAHALGRSREAAVLLGASARLRGADDLGHPMVRLLVDALRAELGPQFDVAVEEGRAMDVDAATALLAPDALVPAAAGARP